MLSIDHLPENVLLEVLSLVPARDLIYRCLPVCRLWRDIIDSPTLWKTKCQSKRYIAKDCKRTPRDWKMFYFICQLKRNLLKNPCAEEGFRFWRLDVNEGDQWKVEDLPGDHGKPFPDAQVKKYFVTSYCSCEKSQVIDLKEEGYWQDLLDVSQPEIVIKDWFAARHDCRCQYNVLVQLLAADKTVLHEFSPSAITIEKYNDAMWRQMEHTFRNYGPGVRYIYFQHGGSDTQLWAGWYGVRVTNSCVTIEPEDLIG
ncbi:F-box only protein 6-like [Ascaphus truei]|uniref:F-box only protein 6-like n=1 Tax=Ascaphus truei TaxID=8439 RepID=UPI003F592AAB